MSITLITLWIHALVFMYLVYFDKKERSLEFRVWVMYAAYVSLVIVIIMQENIL